MTLTFSLQQQRPTIELRPHQVRAIDMLRQSLAHHRRVVLQLPTGAGKTVIAADIVRQARSKGNRVVFCVPAISLIDQTVERFVQNGIDLYEIGVIQGNHPMTRAHAPVQVASVQTLVYRDLPETDLVIVDECHRKAKAVDAWMDASVDGKLRFIGLTATPWAKGMGAANRYEDLIRPTNMHELMDAGFLARPKVFVPTGGTLDLDARVKTVAGDWHEGELSEAMQDPTLVADIVTTWVIHRQKHVERVNERRSEGDTEANEYFGTLCFAVDRAHARKLYDRFADAGISSEYIDANTPREERDRIGRRLEGGEVDVVVNIGTLTTGVDWDVRCLILARPTKSEMLFVQIIGRALRTAPGKEHALILDHSDTHLRLGMVTDIDYAELDDGKKAKQSKTKERELPLPKECVVCAVLIPPLAKTCPSCGADAPRPPVIEEADGELAEFGATNQPQSKTRSLKDEVRDLGKQQVYSQLLSYAASKGYKDGWAANKYREVFDVWPRGLAKDPVPVGYLISAYIYDENRKFARKQRRLERQREQQGL